jgi:hypothetical protein
MKMELARTNERIQNLVRALSDGADYEEIGEELSSLKEKQNALNRKLEAYRTMPSEEELVQIINAKIAIGDFDTKEGIKTFVNKMTAHPDGSCTVVIGCQVFSAMSSESPLSIILKTILFKKAA